MCKIAILQFCATFNCWNVRLSRFPSPWIKGSPKTKDCYISYARGGVGQGVFGLTTENHSMASSNTFCILMYICTTTLMYDNTSDGEWVGLPSCVWTTSRFQQTQHWRQHCTIFWVSAHTRWGFGPRPFPKQEAAPLLPPGSRGGWPLLHSDTGQQHRGRWGVKGGRGCFCWAGRLSQNGGGRGSPQNLLLLPIEPTCNILSSCNLKSSPINKRLDDITKQLCMK